MTIRIVADTQAELDDLLADFPDDFQLPEVFYRHGFQIGMDDPERGGRFTQHAGGGITTTTIYAGTGPLAMSGGGAGGEGSTAVVHPDEGDQ